MVQWLALLPSSKKIVCVKSYGSKAIVHPKQPCVCVHVGGTAVAEVCLLKVLFVVFFLFFFKQQRYFSIYVMNRS